VRYPPYHLWTGPPNRLIGEEGIFAIAMGGPFGAAKVLGCRRSARDYYSTVAWGEVGLRLQAVQLIGIITKIKKHVTTIPVRSPTPAARRRSSGISFPVDLGQPHVVPADVAQPRMILAARTRQVKVIVLPR
jgi:hypothetical protein